MKQCNCFFINNKSENHHQLNSSNKISSLEFKDQNVFASLDIKSLYTQVPLKEVTEDILTTMYDKNTNSIFKGTKITKNILRKILQLCSQSIFLYN